MRRFILFAVLAGAIIAAGGLWYVYKAPYAAAARFPAASEAVVTRFTTLPKPARADYLALAGYVVEGFLTYATPTNARARYPGLHAGGFGVLLELARRFGDNGVGMDPGLFEDRADNPFFLLRESDEEVEWEEDLAFMLLSDGLGLLESFLCFLGEFI